VKKKKKKKKGGNESHKHIGQHAATRGFDKWHHRFHKVDCWRIGGFERIAKFLNAGVGEKKDN
jgi:hypothetical protein